MARALAVAGVLGAGTALVFSVAFSAFALLPSDRLTWQSPVTEDLRIWVDRPPNVELRPINPDVQPMPDGVWRAPALRDPGVITDPPVLIEPAEPRPIDPAIDG